MTAAERAEAHALFSGWIRACHGGARRRNEIDFRCAADIHDLWRWLLDEGEAGHA